MSKPLPVSRYDKGCTRGRGLSTIYAQSKKAVIKKAKKAIKEDRAAYYYPVDGPYVVKIYTPERKYRWYQRPRWQGSDPGAGWRWSWIYSCTEISVQNEAEEQKVK